MRLTIGQIRDAQKAYVRNGGSNDDTLQARFYARPISYIITWFLVKTKVTANHVTMMALGLAGLGCLMLLPNIYWVSIIGAVLLNVGHLLDYVDGTLAKTTGTVSKFGRYLDSTCDEMVESIIPIAVGFAVGYPLFGALCAILHLISVIATLYSQKYYGVELGQSTGILSFIFKVGINIKALAVPLLLVAVIFDWLLIFLIGFIAITVCEFIARLITGVKE